MTDLDQQTKRKKVLIVGRDTDSAEAHPFITADWDVDTASSASEAVEKQSSNNYDWVLYRASSDNDPENYLLCTKALYESANNYQELVQNTNSAIIRWKRDGTIVFFNEFAQKFFGYSEQEATGRSVNILVPKTESTGADLTKLVEDIVNHPERHINNVNENVRRDGSRVWMTWTNKPILDEDGQVAEILAVGSDITERKQTEDALRASEERYRTLFTSMNEGFALGEAIIEEGRACNFRFLEINDAFEKLTGLKAQDIIGKPVTDYLPNVEFYWIENYCRVALTGEPMRFENYNQDLDKYYDVFAYSPVTGRFAILFIDVTEQRRAEQALHEAEAHKREFYRRTIFGATNGKLLITERDFIDGIVGALLGSWHVRILDDVSKLREDITAIAISTGMDESRVDDLKGCIVESAGNALKHAGGGEASLRALDDGLLFVMSDSGPGIRALSIPNIALVKGYSTSGTLGMGFKLMIQSADRVYLATGPEGTTVAVEVAREHRPVWPADRVSPQMTP